ncbi:MAG: aldehyde dehydrogenase family protein, partial [Flavobacteriales bacterium]
MNMKPHLDQLGLSADNAGVQIGQTNSSIGNQIVSTSPVDGATIGATGVCSADDYETVIAAATEAGRQWRNV